MQETSLINRGMSSDNTERFQPPNTYRYALNATIETKIGNHGSLSNEEGNSFCAPLLPGEHILGHSVTDVDEIVLFIYPSKISIFNPNDCSLSTIVDDPCLNFQEHSYISTSFTIQGCDRIVNFSDDTNPFRTINIDKADYYNEVILGSPRVCDRTLYSSPLRTPTLELSTKVGSTNLQCGLYYVAVRGVDRFNNKSDWSLITKPISLGLDNTTYQNSNTSYHGEYTVSDKCICVRITNYNPILYETFELAFIERVSPDGTLGKASVTYQIPITGSTTDYCFYGFQSQIQSYTTIDEILATRFSPHIVNTHTVLNNRLYLSGNEKYTDYSSFQRYASQIKLAWTVDPIPPHAAYPEYDQTASLLYDEVYAFGVVYFMDDNTISPVFHIPGRPPNNITGTNPYVGVGGIPTFPHLSPWDTAPDSYGPYTPGTQRWQQISTATDAFELGYYQVSTNYEPIATCATHPDGYWGRDYDGNLLESTPIRHHRMPDLSLAPYGRLGVIASNISYPPGAIGHTIVYSDRTTEKTILDRGILMYTLDEIEYDRITPQGYPQAFATPNYTFLSSKILLQESFVAGDYIKVETFLQDPAWSTNTVSETVTPLTIDYTTTMHNLNVFQDVVSIFNYGIIEQNTLDATSLGSQNVSSVTQAGITFKNNSVNTSYSLITLNSLISEHLVANSTSTNAFPLVSIKSNREVYTNLSSITYHPFRVSIDNGTSTYFGGDAFSSIARVTDFEFDLSDPNEINASHTTYYTNEDTVRYPLRYNSSDPIKSNFVDNFTHNHSSFRVYLRSKIYELTDTDYSMHLEHYEYSNAYSFPDSISALNPLPYLYDLCENCPDSFRIYYSDYLDRDSSSNNQKYIRPNNYVNLDRNITTLFHNNNELHALSKDTLWRIPTRTQQLLTQDSQVYLGSASVLASPIKYNTTDIYFSGASTPQSLCSTEYGTVYADDITGRIFLLSGTLNDLSKTHLRNFFAEYGTLHLRTYFPSTPDAYVGTNGIGFKITYDPRHKRVLITKKDYIPLFPLITTLTGNTYTFADPDLGPIEVALTNELYFQNLSYTVSYSFITNSWVSFHSYIPSYSFSSKTSHYMSNSEGIWKGNSGEYQTYFDTKYDHIIDLVHPHNTHKKTTSLMFDSKSYLQDVIQPYSFDRLIVYNSNQVSPLNFLHAKYPLEWNSLPSEIVYTDDTYRINTFRDYSVSPVPIWNLYPTPSIDKELNLSRIDINKSLFELPRFSDYWVGVRLYFNPRQNYKIVTDTLTYDTTPRLR